jgi:hypothetical protein
MDAPLESKYEVARTVGWTVQLGINARGIHVALPIVVGVWGGMDEKIGCMDSDNPPRS